MVILLEVILAIFIIVAAAEILWRNKRLRAEESRKFVHILVGTFAASWGFYLADSQILLLAAAMLAVVFASRFFGLFRSIHNVQRKTWGELFFPLGIAASVVLTDSPWVFMAAMLHVSVADGLAALLGGRYVKKHGYRVFKQQKTVVGTLTFFNASIFITLAAVMLDTELQGNVLILLLVPTLTTLAENIAPYGADDLLVPLSVTSLLVIL